MNNSLQSRFSTVYHQNKWGSNESASGKGSELINTRLISDLLPSLVKELNIETLLDLPCGDFNYMKEVCLGCNYIGADIVPELILSNKEKYKNIDFRCLDITNDSLPSADIILVRDCFVHLLNADILKAIQNIKDHSIKYLLTTSFPMVRSNIEIGEGTDPQFREINISIHPFNLNITKEYTDKGPSYLYSKTLALIDLHNFK